MKNGLINENGTLIYYENDVPIHAGVVKIGEDLYYISKGGVAVTGKHTVHTSMANGLLKHGIYTFADDGKLIEGSYVPLKKAKHRKKKHRRSSQGSRTLSAKTKKNLLIAAISVVLVALLVCVGFMIDNYLHSGDSNLGEGSSPTDGEIRLPEFDEDVALVSDGALALYRAEMTVSEAREYGSAYKPMVFEYDLLGDDGLLTISENENFSDALELFMDGDNDYLEIDNLKTGTKYYYKVDVNGKTYSGSFKTAASTRFIEVEGLYNARDIGGYTTLNGRTVKQGMIIRGTEIDGLVESIYLLPSTSAAYMRDSFRFAYEMDLRASHIFMGEYSSYFGEGVGHSFYTAPAYGGIFDASNKDFLKNIFSDLAKEENYPMYMHCTYGADRTGTVVFLLQAILGMSEEQMIREYQMTGFFSSSYATDNRCDIIIAGINAKQGSTLQEKTINFLVDDIGVTLEEIAAIQSILLE